MMMPSRSAMVTVPVSDGLAGKIALGGHQSPGAVQRAVIARERAENANRSVVKTAPVIGMVEYFLISKRNSTRGTIQVKA